MKLSAEKKQNLLNVAKMTYQGYAALDIFKNKSFTIDGKIKTFFELCQEIQSREIESRQVNINGLIITLTLENGHFQIDIDSKSKESLTQNLSVYLNDDLEALKLLSNQCFLLTRDKQDKIFPANKVKLKTDSGQKEVILGGIDKKGEAKIELYRSHLVTLLNIIEKIEREDDISSLLVALATGTGKTYVQALWMLILSLSDNTGIFSVPENLVAQLEKDIKRLLPESITKDFIFLRQIPEEVENTEEFLDEAGPAPKDDSLEETSSEEILSEEQEEEISESGIIEEEIESNSAEQTLEMLNQSKNPKKIIIASNEVTLNSDYLKILNADPESTFLSFDEQHLLMEKEVTRLRLTKLSKIFLTTFLTATPTPETYKLSGGKPVAIMSSGQKKKEGHGQFPTIIEHHAKNVKDKNKLANYRFWTKGFWENIKRSLTLRLISAIEPDLSSSAVSLLEDLPYMVTKKKDEDDLRWGFQVPMARKMLCIIDDNETLVNFCHVLNESGQVNIYHNGNLKNRKDVAKFFKVPNADKKISLEYRKNQKEFYENQGSPEEKALRKKLATIPLKERLEKNIFHGLVEFVLKDLTGLDEIALNQLRKNDPTGLKLIIKKNLNSFKSKFEIITHYQNLLTEAKIDVAGAEQLSQLLEPIYQKIKSSSNCYNESNFKAFVDNWCLDDELLNSFDYDHNFKRNFKTYTDSHLMVGIMSGMKDSETPVQESSPFNGMDKNTYKIHDTTEPVKKRSRSSLETLNPNAEETSFTPSYLDITEENCDAYFRLGFVGIYVSNKKTQGFSDRNLHTVINFAESTYSSTNNPADLIQGIGRNRGLDDTIMPAYIHALGRDQKSTFELKNLDTDDYYPAFFKAQKKFNRELVKIIGRQVGQDIILWYNANLNGEEKINDQMLKRQVWKFIARALRQVNNQNNHQIKLSRSQLTRVAGEAMNVLKQETKRLKRPHHLSILVRVVGSLFYFVATTYSKFKNSIKTYRFYKLFLSQREMSSEELLANQKEKLTLKILRHVNFTQLIEKKPISVEAMAWITRKQEQMKNYFLRKIDDFLNEGNQQVLESFRVELLIPFFSKLVKDEKIAEITKALSELPILSFLNDHKENFKNILSEMEGLDQVGSEEIEQLKNSILILLNDIPGIKLEKDDLSNFLERAKSYIEFDLVKIIDNAEIKDSLVLEMVYYLQNDFHQSVSAFFNYPDSQKIKQALMDNEKAKTFATFLIEGIVKENFDETNFLTELNKICEEEIQSLETRSEQLQESFEKLENELSENKLSSLNKRIVDNLVSIFQLQLLPNLVNIFPFSEREVLLKEANTNAIHNWILKEGDNLATQFSQLESQPNELAKYVFEGILTLQKRTASEDDAEASVVLTPGDPEAAFTNVMARFEALGKNKLLVAKTAAKSFVRIFLPKELANSVNPLIGFRDEIQKIIQGNDEDEEFLQAISPLVSYNDWPYLKDTIKKDNNGAQILAQELLNLREKTEEEKSDYQANFLNHLNRIFKTSFVSSIDSANQAGESLKHIEEEVQENLKNSLNEAAEEKIATLVKLELLPLLASFIKEEDLKQIFIKYPYSTKALVHFMFESKDKLNLLSSKTGIEQQNAALLIINELLAKERFFRLADESGVSLIDNLTIDDCINPKNHAEEQKTRLEQDLKRIGLQVFFKSQTTKTMLEDSFNPTDYQQIERHLSNEETLSAIINQFMEKNPSTPKEIIELIKDNVDMESVNLLEQRMNDFKEFLSQFKDSDDNAQEFNTKKLAEVAVNYFSPILFHPRFKEFLKYNFGFLEKDELAIFLTAVEQSLTKNFHSIDANSKKILDEINDPSETAQKIFNFIECIKKEDREGLIEFFTLNEEESSFQNLPFKSLIHIMMALQNQILILVCNYNGHNEFGELKDKKAPILPLPEEFKSELEGDFAEFVTQVFFLQGLRLGLPKSTEVSAASNQQKIIDLARIHSHILRPIWWGSNLSNVGYAFIRTCQKGSEKIANFFEVILNGFKQFAHFMSRKPQKFTPPPHDEISADFEETSFDYVKIMNGLSPLTPADVENPECPQDAVVQLEEYTTRETQEVAFFSKSDKKKGVSIPEDEAQDDLELAI